MSIEFLLTALLVVVTPGTGALYTIAAGLSRGVRASVLVNILNPKLTIFFVAFLPQFVPSGAPGALGHMIELSAVFMALTFVVFAAYGWFAAAIRSHVISRPKVLTWLRRVFAGGFAALGARLAFGDV
ncbi:LysE family translocator [Amycolatopsis sp. cg5]|uniref:LysE family translocator n=1 Tax=Amycolatopsis sp. cg5 TaxID=3238802 RepID=UPI003526194C